MMTFNFFIVFSFFQNKNNSPVRLFFTICYTTKGNGFDRRFIALKPASPPHGKRILILSSAKHSDYTAIDVAARFSRHFPLPAVRKYDRRLNGARAKRASGDGAPEEASNCSALPLFFTKRVPYGLTVKELRFVISLLPLLSACRHNIRKLCKLCG